MPAFFVQNEFNNHITLSGYNQTGINNFISFTDIHFAKPRLPVLYSGMPSLVFTSPLMF